MPLLILLFGVFVPRLTIVGLWLLTNWFQGMFASWAFFRCSDSSSCRQVFFGIGWCSAGSSGEWGIIAIAGMVIAALLDLAPLRSRRRRVVYVEET